MSIGELAVGVVAIVIIYALLALVQRSIRREDRSVDETATIEELRSQLDRVIDERHAAVRDAALQRAAAHAAERALIQANADLREMRKENLELVRNATRLLRVEITARTEDVSDPPTVGQADRAAVELAREEQRREEERRRHVMAVTDGEVEPVVTAPPTGWEGEDGG